MYTEKFTLGIRSFIVTPQSINKGNKQMIYSKVNQAFNNFNKWETYNIVFGLMDCKKIKLREIVDIAQKHGISKNVIEMRRRDYLSHKRLMNAVEVA